MLKISTPNSGKCRLFMPATFRALEFAGARCIMLAEKEHAISLIRGGFSVTNTYTVYTHAV